MHYSFCSSLNWRNGEILLGSSESFESEFNNCQERLPDAVNYHNRLQQMQKRDEIVREEIDKRRTEMEQEDSTTDVHIPDPLLHACTEVWLSLRKQLLMKTSLM